MCENTSWQADGHGIESGIASALFFRVPLLLAFAFRRLPQLRDLWLRTLLAWPVVVAASVLLSVIGDGAAVPRREHHLLPLARGARVATAADRDSRVGWLRI